MSAKYIVGIAVIASLLTLGFGTLTGLSIYDVGDAITIDTTPTLNVPSFIAVSPGDSYRLRVSGGNGYLVYQENSEAISIDSDGKVRVSEGTPAGLYSVVLIVMDDDGDYDFKKVVIEIEQ